MPLPQQDEFGVAFGIPIIKLSLTVSMPLPQQDEFGASAYHSNNNRRSWVSMPLPQQDEFGDNPRVRRNVWYIRRSQCRFRSKMNSEHINLHLNSLVKKSLNAASAAR